MHEFDVYTKLKYLFVRICGIINTNSQKKVISLDN